MSTSTATMLQTVGEPIPAETPHAVSVSLPTWRANVGYEEGEEWVLSKMKTGYPRFFIHQTIQDLSDAILSKHGSSGDRALLFPSSKTARSFLPFFHSHEPGADVRVIDFEPRLKTDTLEVKYASPRISAVILPGESWPTAKTYWQHTGEGVSSRKAQYCHELFKAGLLHEKKQEDALICKGPRRYRQSLSKSAPCRSAETREEAQDTVHFIEERFGRNLELKFAETAKQAIKRRIAGSLTADIPLEVAADQQQDTKRHRDVVNLSEDDIYLYPCGMSSIFNTHRTLLSALGESKSVMFGFPYVDTLKILEKWGPGCIFYGHGENQDLDDLEARLKRGEKLLSLFCEFPGNPLLKSPDLARIRSLADEYGFAVVVDETIGNFLNVHVLPFADVVVSSLTKVFSGDSNVMGGCAMLNSKGPLYSRLKQAWQEEYEDNYWPEDAIFMERNSRDFVSRIDRINANAEAVCDVLMGDSRVKQVMYPKFSPSRPNYDRCRTATGGYGGLLSATFHKRDHAVRFFDNLATQKGPSLGTNFTLTSPFVILAHYHELDWAESFGVERDLIRFSVGLEDTTELADIFRRALATLTSD